ncbi:MAG TPA: hypothetical protein VGE76_20875 [Opitutaceae bacterium]
MLSKILCHPLLFIAALAAVFLNVAKLGASVVAVGSYAVLSQLGVHFAPVALGVNSFSTDLILDSISKRTLTYLGNVFAPFGAFSTDFSDEEYEQGQNVRIQVANVGSTAQTNPTNWESGDSGLANVNLLVNQYSVSFHLTPRQLNNKFRLDQLVDINLQNFSNKIMDVAFAPLTSTNFSNITVAQASLAGANLQTAFAAIAKCQVKNCILDGTAYSKLLPTSLTTEIGPRAGLAGFDNFFLNTRWTGAGANVYGFAGGPGAVGMVAGLPEQVAINGQFEGLEQQVLSIDLGGRGSINQAQTIPKMQVMMSSWLSLATRTRWVSFDAMFGATATGDSAAGILFKSA